jgi:putative ATPase
MKLEQAVTGSLQVADELKCASIALPAISTGIFGYPKERAVGIIFSAVENYFSARAASTVQVVKLVIYDPGTLQAVQKIWHDKWSQ